MEVKTFLWLPRSDVSEHASMALSNGLYISWRSDKNNPNWPSWEDDIVLQKNNKPDLTFTAAGLDELSIEKWWKDIKITGWKHWLTPHNCFSNVVSALRAGGADRKLTTRQQWYYKSIFFWNAEKLTYYVTDLESIS